MLPTNFLFFKSKPMTLWCLSPQVTPTHWQKWKDSFQEARTLRGLSIIWYLNSSSASLSVSFESVVAKENFETDKERNKRKMARKVSVKCCVVVITGCSIWEEESNFFREREWCWDWQGTLTRIYGERT